ncbi:helix-turn-helix domain-containing protein [Streptomyces sp. NPDC003023]|uniref:helix-turn-helix domain-containing protein n=1 Tax=Streptomyces sp. NPDC003023 TaxID=3364675 RepID=UPI00368B27C8
MTNLVQLTQSLARNLRHWRAVRGLTLDALADRAGVSRGMVIQIEQARTNPSLGTTVKLADALGLNVAALLDQEQDSRVRVVPEAEAVRLWSTAAGSSGTLLVGVEARGAFELWQWRLRPGESSASDPHPPGTVELLHVTAGELTLAVAGTDHTLPAGCSAAVEADVPHSYRNDGQETVDLVMAATVPPTH